MYKCKVCRRKEGYSILEIEDASQTSVDLPPICFVSEGSWSKSEGAEECVYLCGNSLGLKPKTADGYMNEQLDAWGKM